MRYALTALPVLALVVSSVVVGCTIESNSTPNHNTSSSSGGNDDDAGTTPPVPATLPFQASNIDLKGIDASQLGDVVIGTANCTIDSTTKEIACIDNDLVQFVVVNQPGGGQLGVYVAKSWRVEPNAGLLGKGTFPLALVALDSIDVQGTISVAAQASRATPGGFVVPTTFDSKGGGEGGGGAGSTTNAAGGGGFCGVGGKGAGFEGATAAEGGVSYGTPELVPLIGGSAGGNGTIPAGGAGGGAVQLVAGKTFTLGANALINAGGGGGGFGGAPDSQHASGGGAGGAILIEAPTATISGTLLAEGGSGGSDKDGLDARPDGSPAEGPMATNGSHGGDGSGSGNIDGGDGEWFTGDRAAGGGGASGRIRINTTSGNSALTAKLLSPSATSACTTEGTLTVTTQ